MSTESLMASNHLVLCRPLLLLPSVFPSIRVFSNESALRIRCPEYWSFHFSISPSNEQSGWAKTKGQATAFRRLRNHSLFFLSFLLSSFLPIPLFLAWDKSSKPLENDFILPWSLPSRVILGKSPYLSEPVPNVH